MKWIGFPQGAISVGDGEDKRWTLEEVGVIRIRSDAILVVTDAGKMQNSEEWCMVTVRDASYYLHIPADDLVTLLQGIEDGRDLRDMFEEEDDE